MHLLRKNANFEAFQHDVIKVLRRDPIRMPSYCVLSNHWHFVVWPETDGQVTKKKGKMYHGKSSAVGRDDGNRPGRPWRAG
jgi:hypothetical protein